MSKPTPIAAAVRGEIRHQAEEVDHEAAAKMRSIIARDAGITGNRAALQRSLTGQASTTETERERKARLIKRGTERMIANGIHPKDAEKIARRSYQLAKQDAKA